MSNDLRGLDPGCGDTHRWRSVVAQSDAVCHVIIHAARPVHILVPGVFAQLGLLRPAPR